MVNASGRRGRFIAVANMKGGVGKTTTVVSLAETFASLDPSCRVLIVDLDPQASASICVAGDELLAQMIEAGRTLDAHLALRVIERQRSDLLRKIRTNLSNATLAGDPVYLSLLASGAHLRILEREIIFSLTKRRLSMDDIHERLTNIFSEDFEPLREHYDLVIFDCPPGISPVTEIAIASADLRIIPTIPDRISGYGLSTFCDVILGDASRESRLLPRVLLTRVQKTLVQHKMTMADLEQAAAGPDARFVLFDTQVPMSAQLATGLVTETVPTMNAKYGAQINTILAELAAEIRSLLWPVSTLTR